MLRFHTNFDSSFIIILRILKSQRISNVMFAEKSLQKEHSTLIILSNMHINKIRVSYLKLNRKSVSQIIEKDI